jgi:protease IV
MSSDQPPYAGDPTRASQGWPRTIVVQQPKSSRLVTWILLSLLLMSGLINVVLFGTLLINASSSEGPNETHVSGTAGNGKLAILEISGTIMPPFTERWLKTIDAIKEDSSVAGVILRVDSPGGLVADSHQVYHALTELREERNLPMIVSMGRIAASGGYYIAMGAGPEAQILAEPTTWTGSIGVMIPRYDISGLGEKVGVDSDPLTTGPYKDSLNPFRELSEGERQVWEAIMNDAFKQFKGVIETGRSNLDAEAIESVATGQVFTASQSLENGLVDAIGFEDDAIATLTEKLGLQDPLVVRFEYPPTLVDLLLGSTDPPRARTPWETLLEAAVPRAMYFCGWNAGVRLPAMR